MKSFLLRGLGVSWGVISCSLAAALGSVFSDMLCEWVANPPAQRFLCRLRVLRNEVQLEKV